MLCQIIAPQKQVAHLASLSFAIVFATSAFPSVSLRKIWQFYVTDKQLRCDYALYAHTSQGLVNVCFANNALTGHNELEEFWKTSWFFSFFGTFFLFLFAPSGFCVEWNSKWRLQNWWQAKRNQLLQSWSKIQDNKEKESAIQNK